MPDIIHLLPDNLANQIAAGEVIQRPASAVKELLENAVDAGATSIQLIVNDAGKALVQVVDNGSGMSETDARMAFERHATSKIRSIDDLFHIRTMGFRGEALASIAAVAQVELKTKRDNDTAGVFIEIENSRVARHEPAAIPTGTSISMKNLFFNVPARRNFLKSNTSELKHIVDEFIRVALAFPDILFTLTSNGQEVFHLERGSLKQRLVQILGNSYNAKLVSVQEKTDYLDIHGFVGKPDTAKKTRGDQYFFVNNRFIKSAYLNHAVQKAFEELVPKDSFPMYALFINLDPTQVDINVHPTKQEIKFEDEKIVYAFVHSAVKHALAQFSITPTLDFELDANIQQLDAVSKPVSVEARNNTYVSPLYQTFTGKHQAHIIESKAERRQWRDFYETTRDTILTSSTPAPEPIVAATHIHEAPDNLLQLHYSYIIVPNKTGYWLVNQQNAHERILYERYTSALQGKPIATQQSLFPVTIELGTADAVLLKELLTDLQTLGFHLEAFGNNSFIIHGTPADSTGGNTKREIEAMLEQYKHFSMEMRFSNREKLVRTLAWQQAIRMGVALSLKEMQQLVGDLLNCQTPNTTPNGKPTYMAFRKDELDKMFGR